MLSVMIMITIRLLSHSTLIRFAIKNWRQPTKKKTQRDQEKKHNVNDLHRKVSTFLFGGHHSSKLKNFAFEFQIFKSKNKSVSHFFFLFLFCLLFICLLSRFKSWCKSQNEGQQLRGLQAPPQQMLLIDGSQYKISNSKISFVDEIKLTTTVRNTKATMHNNQCRWNTNKKKINAKLCLGGRLSRLLNQIALIFIFQRNKSQCNEHRQVQPLELSSFLGPFTEFYFLLARK